MRQEHNSSCFSPWRRLLRQHRRHSNNFMSFLQAPAKAVEPRLWKKGKAAARVKREYRTAEEVLAEASEKPAAQPILDMRGPQARLITDMEALGQAAAAAAEDTTPMPELQHNLQLLVDLAAADIQRIDAKLRHEKVLP